MTLIKAVARAAVVHGMGSESIMQMLTIKIRLRDKHATELNRQARAVNYVWNYLNEVARTAWQRDHKWLSKYDLQKLTSGSSKYLDIHSNTIQKVCQQFCISRDKARRAGLRWRGKKSLGWVPFNTGHVAFDGATLKFRGAIYQAMHLNPLLRPSSKIGAGSFNQDNRGHWYINLPIEVECSDARPGGAVGIDLGLKELATLSDGKKIDMPAFYRKSEAVLATLQRARKKNSAKSIHRKIANRRKDFLHKASNALAKEYGFIAVGDVSPSKLAQTKMAKSVLDAGWYSFKKMLSYKAIRHGGRMVEVNERYTTQTCSSCGSLPQSRPRGIAGLGIREWTCDDCKTVHDRDVNAAKNILRIGLDTLAEGAVIMNGAAINGYAKHD